MNSKKLLTKVILCVLALVSLFAFVGCSEEEGAPADQKDYIHEKQYENKRYYFSQGYPNDWKVAEGEDGVFLVKSEHKSYNDIGLVSQFSKGKAKYSVYSLKYNFMTASEYDYVMGLLGQDPENPYEFNKYFYDDKEYTPSDEGMREAFVWDKTIENIEDLDNKEYTFEDDNNEILFRQLTYSFTVDGVDWKGAMFVTAAKEGFYVITTEAEASVWDSEFKTMTKMVSDFHITGFETKK